ncbi:MAG TPA: DinB family protein [Candidatus Angelobacter sp.]
MAEAKVRLSPVLQSALESIDRSIDGMSDEQMMWHPEGKWSAAEILEHLSLAYSRTTERMTLTLQQGAQPQLPRRTMKEWVGGLIVLRLSRIPAGRKAPEALLPKGMSPQDVRSSIRKNLAALDRTIDGCEERFGGTRKVLVHAVLGPLSAREWRKFHRLHTLHHVGQIEELRAKMKQTEFRQSSA